MGNNKFLKNLYSLAITLFMIIGSIMPVTALGNNGNLELSEYQGQIEQATGGVVVSEDTVSIRNNGSITVPITFSGSSPDIAQVVVSPPVARTFSFNELNTEQPENNPPKRVETKMIPLTDDEKEDIKLITADKYFLNDNIVINKQLFVVITGMDDTRDCHIRISTKEDDDDNRGSQEEIKQLGNLNYVYYSDISEYLDGKEQQTVYISLWKKDSESKVVKAYQTGPLELRYVKDTQANLESGRYISINEMNFDVELTTPMIDSLINLNDSDKITINMINANDEIIATSDVSNSYIKDELKSNLVDTRYKSVFNWHEMKRKYIYFYTKMYRTKEWSEGVAGFTVTVNGEVKAQFDNVVEIVDGFIIQNISTDGFDGYPPLTLGSNQAIVRLFGEMINKDAVNVRIKDESGNTIGSTVESRYHQELSNCIVYKVEFDGESKYTGYDNYYVECSSDFDLYYNGAQSYLNIERDLYIYDYELVNGNKAELKIKAVNSPGIPITFELYKESELTKNLIAKEIDVPLDREYLLQFKDKSGVILDLNSGTYIVKYSHDDGRSVYTNTFGFNIPNDAWMTKSFIGKRFFTMTDTKVPFYILLSKGEYGVSLSDQYEVTLVDRNSKIVGLATDDITINNESISPNVDAISLNGTISINSDMKLTEGNYYINIKYTNELGKIQTITSNIVCVDNTKLYATSTRTQIRYNDGIELEGSAYMVKKDEPYDTTKFTYVMTDLLGNTIKVSNPVVSRSSGRYEYEDYYNIIAKVEDDISTGYYYIKPQYDGKDIYNTMMLGTVEKYMVPVSSIAEISYPISNEYGLVGFIVEGKVEKTAIIKALIYDRDNNTNFRPVKTVELMEYSDMPGYFVFTKESLSGLDLSKEYCVAVTINGVHNFTNDYIINTIDTKDIPVT
ncbi:MAG: hypothetical protein GX129_07315, partial [Clostridiales bacterium]|nr:hypothetical protein [Clostridiales bacterium]